MLRYYARTLLNVALSVVVLGPTAANAANVFYAFDNTDCEGDHAEIVSSRVEVADNGYLSYTEGEGGECVDVSRLEVVVVTAVRVVTRIRLTSWSVSRYGHYSDYTISWHSQYGAWHAIPRRPPPPPPPPDATLTGKCARPIDLFPANTPSWIISHLPEHHDVRTRRIADGRTSETTRGFFAVDMTLAVIAAVAWKDDRVIFDGFVDGRVEDSAATAGPCNLSSEPAREHDRVRAAITASSSARYHLIMHNCQHWAAKMLRK